MATDKLDLESAVSKLIESQRGDLLRTALSGFLAEMMRREVEQLCGAGYHERSEERETSRNGYRERALSTRLGDINLEIPKLRSGSYFPSFLTSRRRWEKAFVNVISEAYLQGISTRKVESLMEVEFLLCNGKPMIWPYSINVSKTMDLISGESHCAYREVAFSPCTCLVELCYRL